MTTSLNKNVAFAPKYTKIGNIGMSSKIEDVYGMASRIHGFRPKPL
jgi:hypothetical protein